MLPRRLRLVVATLLAVSLTLVILDLRGGQGPFSSVTNVASSALGGAEKVLSVVVSPVTGFTSFWSNTRNQKARIDQLEAQNAALQVELKRAANDKARADSLDSLLKVAGLGRYRIVPAQVIAVGPTQDFTWTVTIDAGSSDGIVPDETVISGLGLVGRVAQVQAKSAVVVLIIDPSMSVGARVAGTQEIGILSGVGRQDSLQLNLLNPLARLNPSDALVTFGSQGGRPYVPGVPVGEVVSVSGTAGQLTKLANIRPFVDFTALSVVGVVINNPRTNPRDSVLPAIPSATLPTMAPTPGPSGSASPSSTPRAPGSGTAGTGQLAPATPVPGGAGN